MCRNQRVDGAPEFAKRLMRPRLVLAHQPAETNHVRVQNGGEFPSPRAGFENGHLASELDAGHRHGRIVKTFDLRHGRRALYCLKFTQATVRKRRRSRNGRQVMGTWLYSPRSSAAFFALLFVTLAAPAAWGSETRLAISGYDPIAYFTDGKPVPGLTEFEYVWHDARWRFSSASHRDLFVGDPNRYAPQYDGYCAGGVADAAVFGPHKDTVDPEAWAIVDGKLYLTHTRYSLERWRPNMPENIKQADANWLAVAHQPEPTLIARPCADHPPSVIVSVQGGGRRAYV